MDSCDDFKAILEYFWKPTYLNFRVVNKTPMTTIVFCIDFPINIYGHSTSVNLYHFDTGYDILPGQYFVRRHLPMAVNTYNIQLNFEGDMVIISSKSYHVTKVII